MATSNPTIVRMATEDPVERVALMSELARRDISPHDNTVDYLLHVVRAGALTAQYLISAASRESSSDASVRMGAIMNWLWGAFELETEGRTQTLTWLDHSLVTLAAFSPTVEQLSDGAATEKMDSVAFLDLLDDARLPQRSARRPRRLALAGRRIAERIEYNAVREARRALLPWQGIEVLNGFETVAGDIALFDLVGGLEVDEIDRNLESVDGFAQVQTQWSLAVTADMAASHDISSAPDVLAPRPTASELIASFATADELRDRDMRAQMLVWFGTDRAPILRNGVVTGFQNQASLPREVHYGRCLVTVPRAHRFGEIQSSWWKRVVRRSGDAKLKLQAVECFDGSDAFAASINETLADDLSDEHSALIYIHGYNTSFGDAAIRSAQLGFDLNIEGITGFYSWPSAAKAKQYHRDADNVAASEPPFSQFLDSLTSMTQITRLNFIVHSMGNRLVAEALQSVAPTLEAKGMKFGAIVLAAPDINVDRFRQLAAVYPKIADNTTMYVSDRDRALGASRFLWDSPRAGLTPPITVVPGVDTIEVSEVDVSRLGHGYYAAAHPVLYDIREVLRGVIDPGKRSRLRELHDPLGAYWQLTL